MDDLCQFCYEDEADRVLGVDPELGAHDAGERLTIEKRRVRPACSDCATELVEAGEAREMPPDEGDLEDVWRSKRVVFKDGEGEYVGSTKEPRSQDEFV